MFFSKRFWAFSFCISSFCCLFAQQAAQSLMFVYDPLLYNGAVVTKDEISCNLHFDKQMLNVEGSPTTFFLTASAPLLGSGLGVGGEFLHQSIGVNEWTDLQGALAYRLQMSEDYALSMAVGGEWAWHCFNDSKLANEEDVAIFEEYAEDEPIFTAQIAFWLDAPSWHFSFSAKGLRLAEGAHYQSVPHGYLSASRRFSLDRSYALKVDMLVMVAENSPISFLIAPNLDCANRWNFSLMYEIDHYVGTSFKLSVCKNFHIGGAYSYAVNSLMRAGAESSFALLLGFALPTKEERMTW